MIRHNRSTEVIDRQRNLMIAREGNQLNYLKAALKAKFDIKKEEIKQGGSNYEGYVYCKPATAEQIMHDRPNLSHRQASLAVNNYINRICAESILNSKSLANYAKWKDSRGFCKWISH